ncbi:Flp pilus assembly pilin Flp [Cerasibacillus quisquiliarum]|uniref:Putative Flagellin Flp1-like domain-containing protein n=1 Tax=Cerasibacillus quisquiliarum TaxID=227865 RepID=A0A511V2S0_9BACI|nr:Flp1 family type IVb pilin [Cerasibacillus quisquiliarum]MBB5147069.1 Flp pilus assembly pilin Flp [Cerasibacillus quisquiliarum]GEN32033.1 hypothetical protein CQU01_22710 [Cerasibacillus quisquiliarum]
MKNFMTEFWNDEEGLQTLEIMLIIAVIVAIALIFRKEIVAWIQKLVGFGNDNIDEFNPQN